MSPSASTRERWYIEFRRRRRKGVVVEGDVVIDDRPAAEVIAAHAERTGAELVAMTTRGRGPLSRLFRSSVPEEVVCRVGVPVLLTRHDGAPD